MKKQLFIFAMLCGATIDIANAQTTFNDVAGIFYANCTRCHNPDGIGPFPMTSYDEIKAYSSTISHEVSEDLMPPWLPDTTYTKFLHSDALSAADKAAILSWVEDGTVEGDPSLAPAAPTFAKTAFPRKLAGEADLVIGIGGFASNATPDMTDPYNCIIIPMELTEGKWLRALEIRPGNYAAVHHVVVSVDTTTKDSELAHQIDGDCGQQPGDFGIGGWSSGAAPVVYPNKAPFKAGQYLPKGSKLVIQMHYAPGSDGEIDSTKVRLFFYDNADTAGIRAIRSQVLLQNWISSIGANTKMTMYANQGGLGAPAAPTVDYSIYAVNPHSHFVCTSIKNYAYKGTDTVKLININRWDYHWQGYYYLPKMLKISSDYTLKSEHVFDNTANNPELLTDPNNSVSMGQGTEDEMLFDAFVWTKYQAGDENIDIGALIENDPIFATGQEDQPYEPVIIATGLPPLGIEDGGTTATTAAVYPNPAADKVTIALSQMGSYTARIYDIAGQTALTTQSFNNKLTVDVSSIPAGIYFIAVTNTATNETTTSKVVVAH